MEKLKVTVTGRKYGKGKSVKVKYHGMNLFGRQFENPMGGAMGAFALVVIPFAAIDLVIAIEKSKVRAYDDDETV